MYNIAEIRKEMESGSLEKALLMLRLFSLEHDLELPFKWASSELYGYSEPVMEDDEQLPWWRFCVVIWIDHNNRVVGGIYEPEQKTTYKYEPERDCSWVYLGIKDIENQINTDLPETEFRIPPPKDREDKIAFGMVYRDEFYKNIREAGTHLLFDIYEIFKDKTFVSSNDLETAKRELIEFRNYVERQAYKDIFINDKPQENIARSLLQAFLTNRSYREVDVRGGQTDILSFQKNGRLLYETKIWRGEKYHAQGLREIEEYIQGEGDDGELIAIFYVVFDPTKTCCSRVHLGSACAIEKAGAYDVYTITICLAPPQPSKVKKLS